MKIRRRYIFSGRVQGVGFRYRAYYAASEYGVTGWIKNCDYGDVEMEAEGEDVAIDKVIASLEKGTFIRIDNMSYKEIPTQNDSVFQVRS